MQAKISIQLIAPDKAIKQSRDLKCAFVFANLHSYHPCPDRTRSQGSKNQSVCTYYYSADEIPMYVYVRGNIGSKLEKLSFFQG